METNVYNLLGQHSHWNINKALAKEIGIEASLLLSDLISKRQYFIMNKDISDKEWFFNTAENIEMDTTLSPYQQRKCIDILVKNGFIEVKRMGIPAKQHFKIFDNKLLSFLTTVNEKTSQLDVKFFNNYINKNKLIRLNNEIKVNKSIEKENNTIVLKEKESTALSIPDKDTFVEFGLLKAKEYEYNVSRSSLLKKYDFWNSSNWINQKTKEPILNWKKTLINSLKYLNEINTNNSTNAGKNINLAGEYEVRLDANNEPIAPMFKDYNLDFLTYSRHYNIYAEYCKKNGLEIKYKKADWS